MESSSDLQSIKRQKESSGNRSPTAIKRKRKKSSTSLTKDNICRPLSIIVEKLETPLTEEKIQNLLRLATKLGDVDTKKITTNPPETKEETGKSLGKVDHDKLLCNIKDIIKKHSENKKKQKIHSVPSKTESVCANKESFSQDINMASSSSSRNEAIPKTTFENAEPENKNMDVSNIENKVTIIGGEEKRQFNICEQVPLSQPKSDTLKKNENINSPNENNTNNNDLFKPTNYESTSKDQITPIDNDLLNEDSKLEAISPKKPNTADKDVGNEMCHHNSNEIQANDVLNEKSTKSSEGTDHFTSQENQNDKMNDGNQSQLPAQSHTKQHFNLSFEVIENDTCCKNSDESDYENVPNETSTHSLNETDDLIYENQNQIQSLNNEPFNEGSESLLDSLSQEQQDSPESSISLQSHEEQHVEDVLDEIEKSLNLLTRSPRKESSQSQTNCLLAVESEEQHQKEGMLSCSSAESENDEVEIPNAGKKNNITIFDQCISKKEHPNPPWESQNTSSTINVVSPNQISSSTVTIVKKEVSITYEVSNFSHNVECTETNKLQNIDFELNQIENIRDSHLEEDLESSAQEVKRDISMDSANESSLEHSRECHMVATKIKDDVLHTEKPEPADSCDTWVCSVPPPPGEDDLFLSLSAVNTTEEMDVEEEDEDDHSALVVHEGIKTSELVSSKEMPEKKRKQKMKEIDLKRFKPNDESESSPATPFGNKVSSLETTEKDCKPTMEKEIKPPKPNDDAESSPVTEPNDKISSTQTSKKDNMQTMKKEMKLSKPNDESESLSISEPNNEVLFIKLPEGSSEVKIEEEDLKPLMPSNKSDYSPTNEANDKDTSSVQLEPADKCDPWANRLPPPPGEEDVVLPSSPVDTAEDMDLQDDDEDDHGAPVIQDAIKTSDVKISSDIVEVSPGQFETDCLINDLPNMTRSHILLVGLARNEISKVSGVAVYSRGKFVDPNSEQRASEMTPLHLHIEGPSRQAVECALTVIEKLKNEVDDPEKLLKDSFGFKLILHEKVLVGVNSKPSLEISRLQVLGADEENLNYIRTETGAQITLRGWGSGFLEKATQKEAPEPMYLLIEHSDREKLTEARSLAEHLVMSICNAAAVPQQKPLMIFPTQPAIPLVPPIFQMRPMVYEALPVLRTLSRPTIPPKNVPKMAATVDKNIPQSKPPFLSKPILTSRPVPTPSKIVPVFEASTKPSAPTFTKLTVPPPVTSSAPPIVKAPLTPRTKLSFLTPNLMTVPGYNSSSSSSTLHSPLKAPFISKIGSRFSSETSTPSENKVKNANDQQTKKPIKKIAFSIITASKKGGVQSSKTFTADAKQSTKTTSKFSSIIDTPQTSVQAHSISAQMPSTIASSRPGKIKTSAEKSSYPNTKLIQVMNLLLKALQLQISTMSAGSQRNQLQQIFQLLQKALPQQPDAVITPQQRAQLQTIITLLEKGLQTITSGDPPTQLINIMHLLQKVLVAPQPSVRQETSTNPQVTQRVPIFTPQTTKGNLLQSSVSTMKSVPPRMQASVSGQPLSVHLPPTTTMQPQVQQRMGFTQQPVFPSVQNTIQQSQTTYSVQQTFSTSTGGMTNPPPQPVTSLRNVAPQPPSGGIQHQALVPASVMPQTAQVGGQMVRFTGNTQPRVPRPNSQLSMMLQLLQTALQSHANSMAEGPSKELVLQIAQMLVKSHEDQDSHKKLVGTLNLLEQALKMPSFATTSGQQMAQLSQILQLVQQALLAEPAQTHAQPVRREITMPATTYSTPSLPVQMQNPFMNVPTVQQAMFHQQTTPANALLAQLSQALNPLQQCAALGMFQQSTQSGNLLLGHLAQLLQQQQVVQQSRPLIQPANPLLAQVAQGLQVQQPFNTATVDVPANNQQTQLMQLAQQLQAKVEALATDASMTQSTGMTQQSTTNSLQQAKVAQLTQEIQKFNELLQNGLNTTPGPPTIAQSNESMVMKNETEAPRQITLNVNTPPDHTEKKEAIVMKNESEVSRSSEQTELSITTLPYIEDSLTSSLAYVFFGPFETLALLTRAGTDLRLRVVKYIRDHRHLFFKNITNYYDQIFPNHGLDPNMAFEHCCVYLHHPEHAAVSEILFTVATMYKTPIVVLHEDGRPSQRVDPFQLSSTPAVTILSRKNNTFAPVDKVLSEDQSQTVQRVFPLSSDSSKPSILVATWHVQKASTVSGPGQLNNHHFLDECLALRRVDVACLQGVGLNTGKIGKLKETPHYDWYGTGATPEQESVVILVRKNSGAVMSNFHSASNGVATGNILFHGVTYNLFGVYLPHSSSQFHSSFCESLKNALSSAPRLTRILVLGDFNACIGSLDIKSTEKKMIGKNLMHKESNRNGTILLNWSRTYELKIVSSFPSETPNSKFTWRAGNELFQVSHILIQSYLNTRTRNFSWWESCSDHAIVASNLEDGSSPFARSHTDNPYILVATWNVINTISQQQRNGIDKALANRNVDLACIQGTHLRSHQQLSTDNYHWWFPGNQKELQSYGVAFLLRKNKKASLTNVVGHTSRVATASLLIKDIEIAVVGCDLPNGNTTQQVFCDILQAASQASPSAKLLVLGEFNATIGAKGITTSEKHLISESGTRKHVDSNTNGHLLKNLAVLYDLYICTTFVEEPNLTKASHILFQHQLPDEMAQITKSTMSNFPIVAINISTEP